VYFDDPNAKGSLDFAFINRFSKDASSFIMSFFRNDWYRNLMLSSDTNMHSISFRLSNLITSFSAKFYMKALIFGAYSLMIVLK
jgi:hypothetical protein